MAVDLINFQKMLNQSAGSEEMNNMEAQLIRILQSHNHQISSHSLTKKTGHARFRRAPPLDTCTSWAKPVEAKLDTNFVELNKKTVEESKVMIMNSGNSCGSSSITGEEGTVSNGKPLLSTTAPCTFSSGKPPLPTSHRKRSRQVEVSKGLFGKASSSRGCHCCKTRYCTNHAYLLAVIRIVLYILFRISVIMIFVFLIY